MDVGSITAGYTSLKFIKDSLEVMLSYKIDIESQSRINAALKEVGTIQDTLFHTREELFRLQTENEQLRQELKAKEGWENQKSQYQLEDTAGGATVYAFTGTPKHYACPSCFTKATIQILQDRRVIGGIFDCPSCRTPYKVNPYNEPETVTRAKESMKKVLRSFDQSGV